MEESANNEDLVKVIRNKIQIREPKSSTECRIYRVPYRLRKWNKEAYTPHIISIGPFHRDNSTLKKMEECKAIYLKNYIERTKLKLEDLVSDIRDQEESIRSCYAENVDQLGSDDFVKMILFDASFILELFHKYYLSDWKSGDPILAVPPLRDALRFDLLLLENQLPFFVIERLFKLSSQFHQNRTTLIKLSLVFFACYKIQEINLTSKLKIEHFTDLLRTFLLPPPSKLEPPNKDRKLIKHLYSATQLREAGVKFKVGSSDCCFLDIKFKKGVLEIPCLVLFHDTEALVRNVMALEQTHYIENKIITHYFLILDFLINTTQDVNLLCDKKIMVNYLGDNRAARTMVNKLNKGINYTGNILESLTTDYYNLCKGLNEFYDEPWHSWMATLRHDYFCSPWRTVSTIAAVILLVLTFIQTIFSIP